MQKYKSRDEEQPEGNHRHGRDEVLDQLNRGEGDSKLKKGGKKPEPQCRQ